jgi:hypothetical protein
MFFGTVQETQHHNPVWQESSYIHEVAERDVNQYHKHICTGMYDINSKISSDSSDSQNPLFSHNFGGTYSERSQSGQYHMSGISHLFPRRQPQSSAKDFVEQKLNVSKSADGRTDISCFMDSNPHAVFFVNNEPITLYVADYELNVKDVWDEKENIAELHSLVYENMHESCTRLLPAVQEQQTPAVLQPNAAALLYQYCSHEQQNCQPVSPHSNETPSQHQKHAQSAVPDQTKSPVAATTHVPDSVCKRSETWHHGGTKSTASPLSQMSPSSQSSTTPEKMLVVEARSRPLSPPPPSGSPLHDNTTKTQGLLSVTACHQTCSSGSQHELPVLKEVNKMRGNGNIVVPDDIYIWRSVLDPVPGTDLRMKFVRERAKGGGDSTGCTSKSAPCKEKDKDHQNGKKAASMASSNITVPKDNFICMSASEPLEGIGQKTEIQIDTPKGHTYSASKGAQYALDKADCSTNTTSTSRKKDDSSLQLLQSVSPREPVTKQQSDKHGNCSNWARLKRIRKALLSPTPARKVRCGRRHYMGNNCRTPKRSKQKLKPHMPFGCYYKAGAPLHEYSWSPELVPIPGKTATTYKYALRRSMRLQPVPSGRHDIGNGKEVNGSKTKNPTAVLPRFSSEVMRNMK